MSVKRAVHQCLARGYKTRTSSGSRWVQPLLRPCIEGFYLSESLDLPAVFFRLGAGILHSIEKATQFVPIGGSVSVAWLTRFSEDSSQGTPNEAASHLTFRAWHVSQARDARCLLKLGCVGI